MLNSKITQLQNNQLQVSYGIVALKLLVWWLEGHWYGGVA